MKVRWSDSALEEYHHWTTNDPKIAERIRNLIADIQRDPFHGLGKPEPLRYHLTGYWSRRITGKHRLVYRVSGQGTAQSLEISQCRFHY